MPMRESFLLPATRAKAFGSERQRPPAAASVRRLMKSRRFISCDFHGQAENYLDKGASRVIETFCLVLQQKARLKLSTRRSGCRAPPIRRGRAVVWRRPGGLRKSSADGTRRGGNSNLLTAKRA